MKAITIISYQIYFPLVNKDYDGHTLQYGIQKKGSLIEGYDGDLALVDLDTRRTITDEDTWTRVGWTPYSGIELTGWPMYTIVDGNVVHKREVGLWRPMVF